MQSGSPCRLNTFGALVCTENYIGAFKALYTQFEERGMGLGLVCAFWHEHRPRIRQRRWWGVSICIRSNVTRCRIPSQPCEQAQTPERSRHADVWAGRAGAVMQQFGRQTIGTPATSQKWRGLWYGNILCWVIVPWHGDRSLEGPGCGPRRLKSQRAGFPDHGQGHQSWPA